MRNCKFMSFIFNSGTVKFKTVPLSQYLLKDSTKSHFSPYYFATNLGHRNCYTMNSSQIEIVCISELLTLSATIPYNTRDL